MGNTRRFRVLSVVSACVGVALAFNNCAPGFQNLGEEMASSLDSASLALCTGSAEMEAAPNSRLTTREYQRSLTDLFGPFLTESVVQGYVSSLPSETLSVSHAKLEFDTTVVQGLQFGEVESYARIARQIGDAVATKLKSNTAASNKSAEELMGSSCLVTEAVPGAACLDRIYKELAFRIYRRPIASSELTTLLAVHNDSSNADKYESISFALQYLLQTQSFLYKVEGSQAGGQDIYVLNDYELATRLAFGILGGPPPRWLLTAAGQGELSNETKRQAVIAQLFASPLAQRATQDFYDQWLRMAQMPTLPDELSAEVGVTAPALRTAAIQEVRDFTKEITWNQNGSYADLMTSRLVVPASAAIAAIYGVARSTSAVQAGSEYEGLLNRVGVLMSKADGRSGPILRGARVRTDILCDPMSSPPDSVFSNLGSFDPLDSTRKQTSDITRAGSCMSCHSQLNTLGFAFENYSGLGRYRTSETVTSNGSSRSHPIDAAGSAQLDGQQISFQDSRSLSQQIAASTKGPACMARRYYQFAAGKPRVSAQGCEYGSMALVLQRPDASILDMMKAYYSRPEILIRRPGAL